MLSAINGDLRDQALVFHAMMDTWPRLQKCVEEVAEGVSKAPFEVVPFTMRGEEATPEAIELAEFVEDTIAALRPDPIHNEQALPGFMASCVHGYFAGHAVGEIYYHANGMPRALGYLDARYYAYPRMRDELDRLMVNPTGHYNGQLEDFDAYPGKFLVGIKRGHMGHASVAAPMRSLVTWWLAAHYGLKWLMQFSQNFGAPIRWATYPDGDDCAQELVSAMLAEMGMLGWGAFPTGTQLEIKESTKGAGDLPQEAMIERADRQAEIMILGQSLTSDVGDSGSRALGDVHNKVRQEKIDGVACWVAQMLTHQFVPAILEMAGMEAPAELPEIKVVWPDAEESDKEKAERDQILVGGMGVEVGKEWFYERHGIPMPEPGEEVLETRLPPAHGEEPGAEDDDKPGKEKPVAAKREAQAKGLVMDRPAVDVLTDNVLESVSGTAAVFLSGIRPVFRDLVAKAFDGSLSDEDFVKVLETTAVQLPEYYDQLNVEALQDALEQAIGTGILAGAGERIVTK